jgi:hypothetical protein
VEKPTKIIFLDGKMELKDFCVMWKAPYAWIDGVKYKLPIETWIDERKNTPDDTDNN